MKTFEKPVIEVIVFATESIMDGSITGNTPQLPGGENRLPWG